MSDTFDQHEYKILEALMNGKTIEKNIGTAESETWEPISRLKAFQLLGNSDIFCLRVRPNFRIVNGLKIKANRADSGDFSNSSIQFLLKSGHDCTDGFFELHFLTREDAIKAFDKITNPFKE